MELQLKKWSSGTSVGSWGRQGLGALRMWGGSRVGIEGLLVASTAELNCAWAAARGNGRQQIRKEKAVASGELTCTDNLHSIITVKLLLRSADSSVT